MYILANFVLSTTQWRSVTLAGSTETARGCTCRLHHAFAAHPGLPERVLENPGELVMAAPSPEAKSTETATGEKKTKATKIMRMESTSIFKEYVKHLSEDERVLFQDEFNTYDKTGNGFITIKVALTRRICMPSTHPNAHD